MGFNYKMRNHTAQQQEIVRQRERAERIRKEEAEKRKQEKINDSNKYSFNYGEVEQYLDDEEYRRLVEEVDRYKDTIIKHLLIEEERGNTTLCTPITTKESKSKGTGFFKLFSKEFCFTRSESIINVIIR